MGKLKNYLIELDELIYSTYTLGEFYSPDTFKSAVYDTMKKHDVPESFIPYVNEKINLILEES